MLRPKSKLIVILGPTAAGKTELSIKLAKKFKGEIVSADSRQIYKGMDIGTGKITKKEMQGIPHYLLDVASPKRKFSVAQYQKKAVQAIEKILKKRKLPLLVGGSAFYIYSVVEGWQFPQMKANYKLRKELEKNTATELLKMLKKLSPQRAKTIEQKNKRRLIRAIEIAKTLGNVPKIKKAAQFDCVLLGVKQPEQEFKKRMDKRVDKMVQLGLEKEVKNLSLKHGNIVLKETIGYQEWLPYFAGKTTKKQVIEKIKLHTIQFSKRQMTWFKRDPKPEQAQNQNKFGSGQARFGASKRIHWLTTPTQAEKLIKTFLLKT